MRGVESRDDREFIIIELTRTEFGELLEVLRRAEEMCEGLRVSANEFRVHRIRLERSTVTLPPPPMPEGSATDTNRPASPEDMADAVKLLERTRG